MHLFTLRIIFFFFWKDLAQGFRFAVLDLPEVLKHEQQMVVCDFWFMAVGFCCTIPHWNNSLNKGMCTQNNPAMHAFLKTILRVLNITPKTSLHTKKKKNILCSSSKVLSVWTAVANPISNTVTLTLQVTWTLFGWDTALNLNSVSRPGVRDWHWVFVWSLTAGFNTKMQHQHWQYHLSLGFQKSASKEISPLFLVRREKFSCLLGLNLLFEEIEI